MKRQSGTFWTHFANLGIAAWLLTSHYALGYHSEPLSLSDTLSGFLVLFFGLFSFSKKGENISPWALALIGIWLQFAPLVFWAEESVIYLNDNLMGVLLIAFSILIPGIPNENRSGFACIPKGWSYNPSSWPQRLPIIFFGTIGWFIARYLASFELGYIDTVWDPFFHEGTIQVLTSSVSKQFPIADAGLGALAYTLEVLMACKGGEDRWCRMPWIVLGFGFLVVPLGLVSIILIILQPLVVGSWCSLCIFTALAMMVMIALTIDEVMAAIGFLRESASKKESLWSLFWRGKEDENSVVDLRTPSFSDSVIQIFFSMVWGVSIPWTLLLTALLGIWLMMGPFYFGFDGGLANSDHLLGALTVTFSILSMAEVLRTVRWILLPFGIWIALSPFFLEGSALWDHLLVGILLAILAIHRGKIREHYGRWQKYIC